MNRKRSPTYNRNARSAPFYPHTVHLFRRTSTTPEANRPTNKKKPNTDNRMIPRLPPNHLDLWPLHKKLKKSRKGYKKKEKKKKADFTETPQTIGVILEGNTFHSSFVESFHSKPSRSPSLPTYPKKGTCLFSFLTEIYFQVNADNLQKGNLGIPRLLPHR